MLIILREVSTLSGKGYESDLKITIINGYRMVVMVIITITIIIVTMFI